MLIFFAKKQQHGHRNVCEESPQGEAVRRRSSRGVGVGGTRRRARGEGSGDDIRRRCSPREHGEGVAV